MASLYTTDGENKKLHVHKLIRLHLLDQFGNRYRCRDCNARLKKKSGIVVGEESTTFGFDVYGRGLTAGDELAALQVKSLELGRTGKFTLGPWETARDGRWIRSITTESIVAVVERDLHHKGECEANAALIAAAPTLLEALEEMTATAKHLHELKYGAGTVHPSKGIFARADALIKKAKG